MFLINSNKQKKCSFKIAKMICSSCGCACCPSYLLSQKCIHAPIADNHPDIPIHLGSVTDMPFDNRLYDGIFCYALIHLLNKTERKKFIREGYEVIPEAARDIINTQENTPDIHEYCRILRSQHDTSSESAIIGKRLVFLQQVCVYHQKTIVFADLPQE